jgi:tetratricopeptide (TPR) repeat protein
LGKIIANVSVSRSGAPDHPVLISLEIRGSTISETYSDANGRVGFYNLVPNEYKVTVNDDAYEPFSVTSEVDPTKAAINFIQITLIPRPSAKKDPLPGRVEGSNPYLVDLADYYSHFPKKTLKEFHKGVDADHDGNPDSAIEHYQKALSLSPDFYPAHNNLGAIYVSRQSFEAARTEFEAALKSNQNDGQAYFNLANVLVLTQHYEEARREIDEGLQRRPDSAFGKFLLGSVYTRTGHPELAEKSLQSALEIDPKMSQAQLQLVNLYMQQKRTGDAIAQLETYLKTFPDSPFAPKARDLLKRLQSETASTSK